MKRLTFARVRAASGATTHGPLDPLELARWLAVREDEDARIDLVDQHGEPLPYVRRGYVLEAT